MRAAVVREFGEPAVLRVDSVSEPVAGPGEVVVEVWYASITFVETQLRAGRPPNPAMVPQLPFVPGNGVGGRITEIGDDVDPALLGRLVVTTTGGAGGYAERALVPATLPIELPGGVSVREAAALLADGRTALALARAASLAAGETVLIEAAAGGVGSCLAQLAVAAGAIVVAGVGSSHKAAVVAGLGARHVVDYSRGGCANEVSGLAGELDVVFDGIGGAVGASALTLLRSGGRFFRYGMASGAFTNIAAERPDVQVRQGIALNSTESRELSVEALRLAAAGQLIVTIGQEYPLMQAAAAHAAIESRSTIGKTLLRVRMDAPGDARHSDPMTG